MKTVVSILIALTVILTSQTSAQDNNKLLGKWEVTYEDSKERTLCEFKEIEGKTLGYRIVYVDESGAAYSDNSMVMKDIKFKNKEGTATYLLEYEEEKYQLKCKLEAKNDDEMQVSYKYMGYSIKETWKRKK